MAFETGSQTQYAPDGQRTYNQNGELVTHHGYFETLAAQTATFTRASTAYRQDGSQVAAGVPRYEYARQPAPVWLDTFDTDQLASEYTSGGDAPATWAVSGGVLTGTGGTQATLIKNDLLLQNVEIEVNSDQARASGIVARYQDNNNYYLLTVKDDSDSSPNFEIYKRAGGVFVLLGSADITWIRGTTKLIKFTLHSSRLEAWFDGNKVISVIDATFTGGGVGLRKQASVAFRVLDFKVYHAQQAAMVEEGTTNLLMANQASVETSTTGFGYSGSAIISRDTTNYWHGNASLKVITSGSAANEGFYTNATGLTASRGYTASVWLKGFGTVTLRIREMDSSGVTIGDTHSSIITLTNVWTRYSVSRTFGSTGVQGQLHVRTNTTQVITFYADGLQLEQKAYPTSWQLPGSARANEILTVPTSVLNADKGTIDFDVVVDPNVHTAAANWAMAFAVSDSGEQNQIRFAKKSFSTDWSAVFSNSAGDLWHPTISSSVMTPGVHRVALKWNRSTTTAKVLVDGAVIASNTSAPLPSSFANASGGVAYVGKWIGAGFFLNSHIGNLRISNIDREDSEIAAAYDSGLPLSVDQYTTYLMSMNGTLQPTIRGFGLWTKNGRHILHDPQSGQGIEVWDGGTLKGLIGRMQDGTIGAKVVGGKIYGTAIRSGNEGDTSYTELGGSNPLTIRQVGKTALSIWATSSGGAIQFFDTGRDAMVGQILPYNDVIGQGLRILGRSGTGGASPIHIEGSALRFEATNGTADYHASPGGHWFYGDLWMGSGTKRNAEETENYGKRALTVVESPEQKYIDAQKGRLSNGVCKVTIDPIWLECIEPDTEDTPWLIHLTAYADVGIFVAEIGADYFVVKERNGGTSNSVFVWSMLATRKGYALERLPEVT